MVFKNSSICLHFILLMTYRLRGFSKYCSDERYTNKLLVGAEILPFGGASEADRAYVTVRYAMLLYATLRYATLRYSTLLYATLLYATLLFRLF
jgi:hypothetical protein